MATVGTTQPPRRLSRGWLWLVRVVVALFGLASLFLAVGITIRFVQSIQGEWRDGKVYIGLALGLVLLFCAAVPYALSIWNLKGERTREKGLIQIAVIGAFWFVVGWLVLAVVSLGGLANEVRDVWTMVGIIPLMSAATGGLLLLGGMKLWNAPAASPAVLETPCPDAKAAMLRWTLGASVLLLVFPAALSISTVKPAFPVPYFVEFEALLIVGTLPYLGVLRGLWKPGNQGRAGMWAAGIAAGFLTLLILGASLVSLSGGMDLDSGSQRTRTWGGLAFFVLLGIANLAVLVAGLRVHRATEGSRQRRFFLRSVLPIILCLSMYLFILLVYAEGT